RWPGVIRLTAMQGGGVNFSLTWTVAVAVLLETFVSGLSPLTTAVFVCAPGVLGVVTSVIVTVAPAAIVPMLQLRIAPPVQVPCVVVAETKVLPAGIGSETLTPVSVSGPLFLTTIVQVMLPSPRVCVAGEPLLVIERSTWKAQDSSAEAGFGLPAFVVV